jgi:hypothetical protein
MGVWKWMQEFVFRRVSRKKAKKIEKILQSCQFVSQLKEQACPSIHPSAWQAEMPCSTSSWSFLCVCMLWQRNSTRRKRKENRREGRVGKGKKGREGQGREGKGREGKGREGKGT